MRHNKKINHLSRKKAHLDATLANMTISLIMHKRIFTTLAKAKALRIYAEPIINRAKDDTTNSRRVVFSYLQNKNAVTELFQEIAKKIADRPGGYTRIIKTGNRLGDNARLALSSSLTTMRTCLKQQARRKLPVHAALARLPQRLLLLRHLQLKLLLQKKRLQNNRVFSDTIIGRDNTQSVVSFFLFCSHPESAAVNGQFAAQKAPRRNAPRWMPLQPLFGGFSHGKVRCLWGSGVPPARS